MATTHTDFGRELTEEEYYAVWSARNSWLCYDSDPFKHDFEEDGDHSQIENDYLMYITDELINRYPIFGIHKEIVSNYISDCILNL